MLLLLLLCHLLVRCKWDEITKKLGITGVNDDDDVIMSDLRFLEDEVDNCKIFDISPLMNDDDPGSLVKYCCDTPQKEMYEAQLVKFLSKNSGRRSVQITWFLTKESEPRGFTITFLSFPSFPFLSFPSFFQFGFGFGFGSKVSLYLV
jgi:hypothetical protein